MHPGSSSPPAGSTITAGNGQFGHWLEMLPLAAYVCDAAGRVTFFNERAGTLLGKKLVAGGFAPGLGPQALLAAGIDEPSGAGREIFIELPDSSTRTVLVQVKPLQDESGHSAGSMNVLVDITGRIQVDQSLRQSEERLRLLVDNVPYACFLHGPDAKIIDLNRRACESLGYTREELLGLSPPDFDVEIPPNYRQAAWSPTPPGQPATILGRHRRKDGTTFPVEVRLTRFLMAGRRHCLAIVRDVSERTEVLARLKRQNEGLRLLSSGAADLLGATNLDQSVDRLFALVSKYLGCEMFFHFSLERDGLQLEAAGGIDDATRQALARVEIGQGPCGRVAEAREIVYVEDVQSSDSEWVAPARQCGVRAYVGHPLLAAGQLLGTIAFASRTRDRFDPHELEFIQTLSHYVAMLTQRRHTEQQLKHSEQRFHELADAMPQMVWISRPDGSAEHVNIKTEEYTGLVREELIGWGWRQTLHADDVPDFHRRMMMALSKGESLDVELRIRRHDGVYRWHLCRTVKFRTEQGGQDRWFGTANDIHDRKQAEEALRVSEERFQRFMSNTPTAAWVVDADDRLVYLNPAYTRLTGLSAETVLGRDPRELFPTEVVRVFLENNRQVRETGQALETVESGPRADGTQCHLLVVKFPLAECDERTPVGAVGIDITEHRLLEEQLQQSQKMEAVGRLAGGIAHDFNNLITIISGYSHLLLGELDPGHPMQDSVAAIRDAGERAAALTRQLLAFSRRQVLNSVVLDLNEAVAHAEKMFRRLIGEDIILDVVVACQPSRIKADRGQIEQVLMNLVVNARDAMPQGGRLTIQVGSVEVRNHDRNVYPEARPGRYVKLSVRDTGHGIADDLKPHLFEPFFTTKEIGKGTGLGLAVVHGIVKQSGGHIRVASQVGVGTAFDILFPAVRAASAADQAGPSKLGPGGTETILLVDDEPSVLKIARIILQSLGYHVIEADSGSHAILAADRYPDAIDLLLTDVVMREIDGRQLAHTLRSAARRLRVLYMTGHPDDEVVQRGVRDDNTQLLQKPFAPPTLAATVRAVLDSPARV